MLYILFISGSLSGMLLRYNIIKKISIENRLFSTTTLINITSCFILGLFYPLLFANTLFNIFIFSFLSTFSTFSSFNYELINKESIFSSTKYLLFSVFCSLIVILLGKSISQILLCIFY